MRNERHASQPTRPPRVRPRYLQPPLTPPLIYLGCIPKGYPGTARTVEHIANLIRTGSKDFYVRQKAIDILVERGVQPKNYLGEIKALFQFVQQGVRYTKDPLRVEVLHTARRMLDLRAGDCDDMAILLGSMLEAIGHPVRLVITGPDPLRPHLFTHIYLEVFHQGRWIPLDPTMRFPMGWAPSGVIRKTIGLRGSKMSCSCGIGQTPDWLAQLIGAIQGEAIAPRDARIKSMWDLLRQRGLLRRSRWLRNLLRRIWRQGLAARPRPRTTQRLQQLLQQWGILPASTSPPIVVSPVVPQTVVVSSGAPRPFRPVVVRPLRPVTVRPLRPVHVRAAARRVAR